MAKLLDELRKIADHGLAEEIEEAALDLRAEMIDRAVVWAFSEGFRAGRGETHDEDPAN